MSIRSRRHSRTESNRLPEVILTPLIDTILVILVSFMVAMPLVHNAIVVELPSGQVQEVPSDQEDLVIYWNNKNTLSISGVSLSQSTVIDVVKKRIQKKPDSVVFVQADRIVRYGDVVEFIDILKALAGVKYVALETRAKDI